MKDEVRIERSVAGLAREALFDVVADVERYPEFLAGWESARIMGREGNVYCTDQSIRIGPISLDFRSRTTLFRPEWIEVKASGARFERFDIDWRFDALAGAACRVSVTAHIVLRSSILQGLVEGLIPRLVEDAALAFEARARQIGAAGSR
jgi:coenzyme Q-binding protein COQ10